jgi:hypothetical protein
LIFKDLYIEFGYKKAHQKIALLEGLGAIIGLVRKININFPKKINYSKGNLLTVSQL